MSLEDAEHYAVIVGLFRDSELGPLVSPQQAARMLGMKPAAIQRALKAGRLRGVRVGGRGGRWRVSVTELARYACGRAQ